MSGDWALMAVFPIDLDKLDSGLKPLGLRCFGRFTFEDKHLRAGDESYLGKCGLLIGNAGKDMWEAFSASPEYADEAPDPMNRWTKRELDAVSRSFGTTCIFPFDKPFWPFQRFLESASGVKPSPLGLYIHPEFGLWHALRGVLVLDADQEIANQINAKDDQSEKLIQHPCETCLDKPCLLACPVGAFGGSSLDVKSCFQHLDQDTDIDCMGSGCMARNACPIGARHKYNAEQIRFHMKAYRGK